MPQIIEPQLRAHVTTTGTYYTIDNKLILVDSAIPLKALGSYSRGAIIRGGASQWEAYVHPGAANRVLQTTITDVVWSANAVTFPTAGAVVVGTGVANRVAYWSGVNVLTGDAGMTYNAVTNSLTVGNCFLTDGGQVGIAGNELLTVNAVGTFAFSGITGITVQNTDFIGIGAAAERVEFYTAGCVSVMGANLGVNTITPTIALLQVEHDGYASPSAFFGDSTAGQADSTYITGNTINGQYSHDSDTSGFWINYRGYQNGVTRYRDLNIGDGKQGRIAFFDGSAGFTGFGGTTTPDRLTHAEVVDTNTASIVYANRLAHSLSSGTAQASFGVGTEHELEDAGGAMQVASECVTLWASPAAGAESPLRRWTNYPKGTVGPGYKALWMWHDLNIVNRTVIPNGAGDVTQYLWLRYVIVASDGTKCTGTIEGKSPGPLATTICTAGTNTCDLKVNADGSVTIKSSGLTDTFDVTLFMIWI